MKKELLELDTKMQEEMEDDRDQDDSLQWMMWQALVNNKITSFYFPQNLDDSEMATDLWHSLMREHPPDLHTIVYKCKRYRKSWDVRPFFGYLLVPVFPKLEVLQLANLQCNDQDLHMIAEKLTKLRSVCFFKLNDCLKKCIMVQSSN
jgi:hypothetical protein